LYNRPEVATVPSRLSPSPLIIIKKNGSSYCGSLFHCWKPITTATNIRLHRNDFLQEKHAKWHPSGQCLLSWPPNSYNHERAMEVWPEYERTQKN
jgi:hypothetical protein